MLTLSSAPLAVVGKFSSDVWFTSPSSEVYGTINSLKSFKDNVIYVFIDAFSASF